MHNTGFPLVDGDARRGIAPAVPRHWGICTIYVLIAQTVLGVIWSIVDALAVTTSAGNVQYAAIASIGWLIIPFGALALTTAWLSEETDNRGWAALGVSRQTLLGAAPWVLAGLVAASPVLMDIASLAPTWIATAAPALLALTPATLIQSGAEEVFFRGALLAMLIAQYGPKNGVIISALLFGFWHVGVGQSPLDLAINVSMTFVFGITSAILVLHQGHIGGAIALHFVWNLVGNIDAGLMNFAGQEDWSLEDFWLSFDASFNSSWTEEELLDPATRNTLLMPLLLETLLIVGVCRDTILQVFAPSRSEPDVRA